MTVQVFNEKHTHFLFEGMYKEEPMEDPYSFVDEENMLHRAPVPVLLDAIKTENALGITPLTVPKKRGRKKKIVPELEE